ncbi:hypothetical protein GCM10027345_29100 [Hymenobacter daeguensis]
MVANDGRGALTGKLQILGYGTNHGTRKDLAVRPDAGPVHDGNVRANPGALPNLNIRCDGRKRFNGYARREASFGVDMGEGGKHSSFRKL